MLELGLAFRQQGHQATWHACHAGMPRNAALFRGAPGKIRQHGVGVDVPGYIDLEVNSRPYELHNSVQYRGISATLHEVDLSIISASDVDTLRRAGGGYPTGRPRAALELKRYRLDGSFSVGLMRAMLLGAVDLSLEACHPKPPRPFDIAHVGPRGAIARGYLGESAWIAVTTASQIGSSRQLAQHYGAEIVETFRVDPLQPAGTNPRVNQLAANLAFYL